MQCFEWAAVREALGTLCAGYFWRSQLERVIGHESPSFQKLTLHFLTQEQCNMNALSNTDYRIQRECSKQWRRLLSAVIFELQSVNSAGISPDMLRRIGERFANQSPLPECKSLADLEQAMCKLWNTMDWGATVLQVQGRVMRIVHHGADKGKLLVGALGNDVGEWAPQLIGGVYQQWFSTMGSSTLLQVRMISEIDEFGTVEYQLSL